MTLTLHDRARSYRREFPRWEGSWPVVTSVDGKGSLTATWVIGNDYRNPSPLYGSYPRGYLKRLGALFPDLRGRDVVLHAFSGSLKAGPYTRLDIVARRTRPELLGDVYDVWHLAHVRATQQGRLTAKKFGLVMADPPYSKIDAEKYGTKPIVRRRVLAALATVTAAGGYLCWLDTCWPQHRKTQWRTVGFITVIRSTEHRVRLLTIFERTAHR